MRAALFGESGFIGKEVSRRLREKCISFFGMSRSAETSGSFKADITDYASLLAVEERADVAIICSSALPKPTYRDEDMALYFDVNVTGVHNILRWSRLRGISRVIYCSTLSMVPARTDRTDSELIDVSSHYLYKITKAAGEHLVMGFCREHQMEYYLLRIGSVYGPGMKKDLIYVISGKIKNEEKFIIHNGSTTVDYVHVRDVAKAIVACVSDEGVNEIINVASGDRIKLRDLALTVGHIHGKAPVVEITSEEELPSYHYSVDRMKALIGGEPIGLEKGLKELFERDYLK